ncbi:MAG: formyltransferase family protein [Candidatus Melainabacteria bacterium]
MNLKKLRVVILSNDDLTSNVIFAPLFTQPDVEVVGLAFTTTINPKKTGLRGVFSLLKKMDWRYWLYQVFINGFYKVYEALTLRLNFPDNALPVLRRLCARKNIPVFTSANFNGEDFLSQLRSLKPDLLIIRVNQILRAPVLAIPTHGTWCIHSSLLPAYGGIAAECHALARGERRMGSALFHVSLQLDQGTVLARREMACNPNCSVFSHMLANNRLAGNLLADCAQTLSLKGALPPTALDDTLQPSYYSWPQAADLALLRQRGIPLMHVRDMIRHVARCLGLGLRSDAIPAKAPGSFLTREVTPVTP